jgi:hypothetical protein
MSENLINIKSKPKKPLCVETILIDIKNNLKNINLSNEIFYRIHYRCSNYIAYTKIVSIAFYDNSNGDCILEIHKRMYVRTNYDGEYIGLIIAFEICKMFNIDVKNIDIFGYKSDKICWSDGLPNTYDNETKILQKKLLDYTNDKITIKLILEKDQLIKSVNMFRNLNQPIQIIFLGRKLVYQTEQKLFALENCYLDIVDDKLDKIIISDVSISYEKLLDIVKIYSQLD